MADIGKLICVPPNMVGEIWPRVAPMVDDAYAALDEPTPDVRSWLMRGEALLWVYVVGDEVVGAATTSEWKGRKGRALRVVTVGGEGLALCKGGIAKIEEYAKEIGCYKIVFDGRRGWKRVFPEYEAVCFSLEKRL